MRSPKRLPALVEPGLDRRDYFNPGTVAEEQGATCYQLTYGGGIRTLHAAGLVIEDL